MYVRVRVHVCGQSYRERMYMHRPPLLSIFPPPHLGCCTSATVAPWKCLNGFRSTKVLFCCCYSYKLFQPTPNVSFWGGASYHRGLIARDGRHWQDHQRVPSSPLPPGCCRTERSTLPRVQRGQRSPPGSVEAGLRGPGRSQKAPD